CVRACRPACLPACVALKESFLSCWLTEAFCVFGVEAYSGRVPCFGVCLFDPLCFLWNKSGFNRSALGSSFEILTEERLKFSEHTIMTRGPAGFSFMVHTLKKVVPP